MVCAQAGSVGQKCGWSRQESPSQKTPSCMTELGTVLVQPSAELVPLSPIKHCESEGFLDGFMQEDSMPSDIERDPSFNAIMVASHQVAPLEVDDSFFAPKQKVHPEASVSRFGEDATDCMNTISSPPLQSSIDSLRDDSHCDRGAVEYSINTTLTETSASEAPSKATSESIISDNAPTIDRLVCKNETLKGVVLNANRKLARLEEENRRFMNEGVFDLVNSVCGRDSPNVKRADFICNTSAVRSLLTEDMVSPFLSPLEAASENRVVAPEQEWIPSKRLTDHISVDAADVCTGYELACPVECSSTDATCPAPQETYVIRHENVVSDVTGRTANVHSTAELLDVGLDSCDELKNSKHKSLSLKKPCTQAPCGDTGDTPLKGDAESSSTEESKFNFFWLGLAGATGFTAPLSLDDSDSADLSFDT